MIGQIIGIGDYGWVFSHAEDDDKVVKITQLPSSPAYVDDLTLTNIEQYRLFRQLENQQQSGTETPGLPTIYHSFDGYMDRIFRSILFHRALQSKHPEARGVRRAFPMGCRYGVVIMEKVPCTYRNDFCFRENFRDYPEESIEYQTWVELDLQEEQIYEEMMMFLYDSGWWVRDVRDPHNRGYRIDGSPIWFDPIVVRRDARDIYDAEAQTVVFADFNAKEYERAVESGEYFTRRHGRGLFYARLLC